MALFMWLIKQIRCSRQNQDEKKGIKQANHHDNLCEQAEDSETLCRTRNRLPYKLLCVLGWPRSKPLFGLWLVLRGFPSFKPKAYRLASPRSRGLCCRRAVLSFFQCQGCCFLVLDVFVVGCIRVSFHPTIFSS